MQILEDERAATAQTLNDIAERTDALDARITATSTELARQLDELGTELSAVTDQEPVDVAGIVNGALDEIRNSQSASPMSKPDTNRHSEPISPCSLNNSASKRSLFRTQPSAVNDSSAACTNASARTIVS